MDSFIKTNELVKFNYYGLQFRLDVVIIDEKEDIWIVTKRTSNHQDEETWTFSDNSDARKKISELINCSYDEIRLTISKVI